jgi:hypothetical protein
VWFRRTGGEVEVSLGQRDAELFDGELSWTAPPRVATVPVEEAARVTERAVRALLEELVDRGASVERAGRALARLDAAVSAAGDDERLAWLVGLRGDTQALAAFKDSLNELDPTAAQPPEAQARRAGVLTAVPVATLFGSLSPAVTHDDVQQLVKALRSSSRPDRLLARLDGLAAAADQAEVGGLQDGQAGGELGNTLSAHLPRSDDQVQITQFRRPGDCGRQLHVRARDSGSRRPVHPGARAGPSRL